MAGVVGRFRPLRQPVASAPISVIFEVECPRWNICEKLQGNQLLRFAQKAELVEGKFNPDSGVPEMRKWPFEDPGEIGEVIRGPSEFQRIV